MTDQLSLGLARNMDSDTAKAAARSITGRTERRILEVFEGLAGRGLTDDELAAFSLPNIYRPTLVSARSRLTAHGLVVDSGVRRDSQRGRPQIVWILKSESPA